MVKNKALFCIKLKFKRSINTYKFDKCEVKYLVVEHPAKELELLAIALCLTSVGGERYGIVKSPTT